MAYQLISILGCGYFARIETDFISQVTLFGNCLFCYHSNPMPHPLLPTVKSAYNGCHGNQLFCPLQTDGCFIQVNLYRISTTGTRSDLAIRRRNGLGTRLGVALKKQQDAVFNSVATIDIPRIIFIQIFIRMEYVFMFTVLVAKQLLECKQWEPLWTVATHCT